MLNTAAQIQLREKDTHRLYANYHTWFRSGRNPGYHFQHVRDSFSLNGSVQETQDRGWD